jgi:cellulose synthase/poly-beta-1,6-N-acetylglucosamine synthase-like glycosyltransferase
MIFLVSIFLIVQVLLLFAKVRSWFVKEKKVIAVSSVEADYAVIVTAYGQASQLTDVLETLLNLRYSNYLIYVVADNCDVSGLQVSDDRVIVLAPETVLASNTRSHFYAINRFKRAHDRLVIIDSDNLVDPELLKELNVFFDQGFVAVQGVREAKNLDTTYACLDGARDLYYHYYDGKVLFGAGSSATLAGSGMAFTVDLYRQCLEHLDVSGAGFDKVLQSQILKRDLRIAFAPNAIVYDEKTTGTEQLVNQRARWINTWFRYFSYGFGLVGKGVANFSINQFLFGMVLLRPPLFIFLALSVFFAFINLWIDTVVTGIWLLGLALFVVGFFVALLNSNTDPRIYKSLVNIPRFVFYQILALLKVKTANQRSVATVHGEEAKQ